MSIAHPVDIIEFERRNRAPAVDISTRVSSLFVSTENRTFQDFGWPEMLLAAGSGEALLYDQETRRGKWVVG